MDNLGVVKGMSFAEQDNQFVARPLELGKHTIVFKEIDVKKAFIPKGANFEVIPVVAIVDNEAHTRTQNFTVQGREILTTNASRQHPKLANQSIGAICASLVKDAVQLDMWVVQSSKEGKTYYNWQFYQPIEVKDSEQNDAVANSLI